MKKGKGKNQGQDEEYDQNFGITRAYHQQRKQAYDQNDKLTRHNIRENRAYEKSFFSFEERAARGTVMFYVKRPVDEG